MLHNQTHTASTARDNTELPIQQTHEVGQASELAFAMNESQIDIVLVNFSTVPGFVGCHDKSGARVCDHHNTKAASSGPLTTNTAYIRQEITKALSSINLTDQRAQVHHLREEANKRSANEIKQALSRMRGESKVAPNAPFSAIIILQESSMSSAAEDMSRDRPSCEESTLTVRESDVIRLVSLAKTNRQIAVELGIAEGTVKRHLRNIFKKLGAVSRIDAVNLANL